jgi:hypothetical protein
MNEKRVKKAPPSIDEWLQEAKAQSNGHPIWDVFDPQWGGAGDPQGPSAPGN